MPRTDRTILAAAALLTAVMASPVAARQTGVATADTAIARAQAAVDSVAARDSAQQRAAQAAVQQPVSPPPVEPLAPPRPMPSGPPISADEVTLVFDREIYRYDGGGRRDPFRPLTDENAQGPLFEELQLRMILHSNVPNQSIVVLADTKKTYRLRRGESLGNFTVMDIGPDRVTFAVEDFGIRRQEVLSIKPDNETEGA